MSAHNVLGFVARRRYQTGFSSLLLVLLLSGCQTSPPVTPAPDDVARIISPDQQARQQALQLLYQQHQQWQGTPYRIGGTNRNGIDCSAFVQVTYRDLFGIDLPRTTDAQVRSGRSIPKNQLQPGDLVFFRKGGHVGIYLEDRKFLHASTRRGVIISSLDNSYWSRHYWRAVSVHSPGR